MNRDRFSVGLAITILALLVTTDQWVAATGQADPYQIIVFSKNFSFMAAARGVVIVLAVAFGVRQLRRLGRNRGDRRLRATLITGVMAMLLIETFVIAPYTLSSLGSTELAKNLTVISPLLTSIWAVLVSGMTLLAVGVASVGSLAERPERKKGKGRPIGAKNRVKSNERSKRK